MRLLAFVLLLLCASSRPLLSAVITVCGESVPSGDEGTLATDLVCPPNGIGVHLGSNTRLNLNGHTISGAGVGVYTHAGTTKIRGPGAITGATQVGIYAPNSEGRHRMAISDGVELSGHGIAIALGQSNRVSLTLKDVAIHDNPGSAVADCLGLKIRAQRLTVTNNGGTGLCGDQLRLVSSSVQNNAGIGIFSWTARLRLRDSTVTGNDAVNGWDIATTRAPRLAGLSSCGSSVVVPAFPGSPNPGDPSWGICTGD